MCCTGSSPLTRASNSLIFVSWDLLIASSCDRESHEQFHRRLSVSRVSILPGCLVSLMHVIMRSKLAQNALPSLSHLELSLRFSEAQKVPALKRLELIQAVACLLLGVSDS